MALLDVETTSISGRERRSQAPVRIALPALSHDICRKSGADGISLGRHKRRFPAALSRSIDMNCFEEGHSSDFIF